MKPICITYSSGTIYEVTLLDDIMVSRDTSEITKDELKLWRATGSQKDGKFALSRPILHTAEIYYCRDVISVDLSINKMISTSSDMSEWLTVKSPPLALWLIK